MLAINRQMLAINRQMLAINRQMLAINRQMLATWQLISLRILFPLFWIKKLTYLKYTDIIKNVKLFTASYLQIFVTAR